MTNSDFQPGLDLARQKAVEALCDHFANDVLSLAEFESRVERVHAAESITQLRELLADLSQVLDQAPSSNDSKSVVFRPSALPSEIEDNRTVLAVLSGVVRKGRWVPARRNVAVAILGSVELDFREARLGPGVTVVDAYTLFGSIEVIVPPGVRVECDGVAILGEFGRKDQDPDPLDPDTPTIKINGVTVLGGVEIHTRHPGESKRDARKRRREKRHIAKRERRQLRGDR